MKNQEQIERRIKIFNSRINEEKKGETPDKEYIEYFTDLIGELKWVLEDDPFA